MKCVHCSNEMSEDERDRYFKEAQYCCNGYMCGCAGGPIDPPYCDQCIETSRLATIGEALEWANKEGILNIDVQSLVTTYIKNK